MALPFRIGFEPYYEIDFTIMIIDVIVDFLFFSDLIIEFFIPLKIGHGSFVC